MDTRRKTAFALPATLHPLIKLPNWVVWRWEKSRDKKGNERKTKVPYQARRPNSKASSKKAATWSDYETARDVADGGKADGIGFCLFGSEFAAFDLDDCRDPETGEIDRWAQDLVQRVGSYTEVTISGTGLRIIGRANGTKVHRKQSVEGAGTLETYRQAERYIVMTGNVLPGTAAVLADIDRHIDDVVAELDTESKKEAAEEPANDAKEPSVTASDLDDIIRNGCGERYNGDRSRAVWFVVMELLRRGYYEDGISAILLNEKNKISEHVYDQPNPASYGRKQIEKAISEIDITTNMEGRPHNTLGINTQGI